MPELLDAPPENARAHVRCHHRRDVWMRVWSGFAIRSLEQVRPENAPRRERCRADLVAFARDYFAHRVRDLTARHTELLLQLQAEILAAQSIVASKRAIADPRGFGKTTLGDVAVIWSAVYRHRSYALLLQATGPNAEARLKSIGAEILGNPNLAADFPELIQWLRDTHGGDPRRAPPEYPWSAALLRLPNGVILGARGVDSSVTGVNHWGHRPDLVLMDDCETLDAASSSSEAAKLEQRLKLEILNLHEKGRPAAYLWINTIRRPHCLSQRLTDAKLSPDWRGTRTAAVQKFPAATALWDRFAELCGPSPSTLADNEAIASELDTAAALNMTPAAFSELTPPLRNALQFYAHRKPAMDAGAELLDPHRMPLWSCMALRATDPVQFACELQNDPPEDANTKTLQLEVEYLLSRRLGPPRGIVPAGCDPLVVSIDVGAHTLHWECCAANPDGVVFLVDQGQQETNLNAGGEYKMADDARVKESMVTSAIQHALEQLAARCAQGWRTDSGAIVFPALVGVDCGGTAETFAWSEKILHFRAGNARWIPLKGSDWSRSIADRALGRNWICEATNNPGRRIDANADHYKRRAAHAYELPPRTNGTWTPGARILHADTPQIYAKHQTAERYIESIDPDKFVGRELKVGWNKIPGQANHWWDTCWMSYALLDIVKLVQAAEFQRAAAPKPVPRAPLQPPGWTQRERF